MKTKERTSATPSNAFLLLLNVFLKQTRCKRGGITREMAVNKNPPIAVNAQTLFPKDIQRHDVSEAREAVGH